ncbi:MAG: recombinase family protein [Bacillota bacterium]
MLNPQEIDPTRVAIYIRWSTDDQGEGTTLQTQLERCSHYLRSQGWVYNEQLLYVDDGYSGGTLERPALAQLRRDVAEGRVACVVVYKIDRLSRSVVDIVDLVLREWEGRCFVKSTTEDVNTLSPAGKMFFYILVSFAEYERNVIRERTMGGKVKRAEQGLNPGFRPPYGYLRGPAAGTVAVVEHEASVVRRIFALFVSGNGPGQIAQMLNTEGIRRRGSLWSRLAVRRMLANPAYCGVLEYGRTMRGQGGVVRFAEPRFARVEGAFPAIVEQPVWEEAQRLLGARSVRPRRGGPAARPTCGSYLLSGLARCGRCGATMGGKRAGGRRYYYCSGRKRQGRAACDAGHIPAEAVETAVEERVRALLQAIGPAVLPADLEADLGEQLAELQRAAGERAKALTAVGERRRRLEADYRSGQLPARLYAEERAQVEREEQEIRAELVRLEERTARVEGISRDPAAALASLGPLDLWAGLTVPERRQLLGRLTTGISLYRPARPATEPVLQIDWLRRG